jgi:hypothetical protein
MAELRLLSPLGMYGALKAAEANIAQGHWPAAERWSLDIGDEGRRQMSALAKKAEWRDFLAGTYQLRIAIKAQDESGCSEALAELRACLLRIAGPEIGE